MSRETWETPEKVRAAIDRLTARMPGWAIPAAYGLVLVAEADLGSDRVRFPVVNQPVHTLPALVLSLLTGRRAETATFELRRSELDAAIALLAPAAFATMFNHPNLAAWRTIAQAWEDDDVAQVHAVFLADLDDPISSPYDAALRHQIAAGEQSAPIRAPA